MEDYLFDPRMSAYLEAIRKPNKGPDEVILNDGMFLVERKDNLITVTGIGEIKSPIIYGHK